MKPSEELATRLAFQRLTSDLRPLNRRFILGSYNTGQNEILHHSCETHNIFLIGLSAWELYQSMMPTIRLSPSGHAMLGAVEVEPFEHAKHGELIKEAMKCGVRQKREPFKVYNA